jgi:hypothetical protein
MPYEFPSTFEIGDPVSISIQGVAIAGYIRAVTFTQGKVRYAVMVPIDLDRPGDTTTFHNLDSAIISPRSGERLGMEFDNYS